ncbi:MAG TPA: acyl-CoA dehydrogenase family protein [Candidatus Saccharimonadales bacterium]|jgi:citronellyl-CoA dehydrogenase|nr:acyl-CoA dehydrogenase family protein [Candidatus Saccharimonadales bacterium]
MSTQTVQQPTAEFPYFNDEHDLIRKSVERFCKEEIAPHAEEWDEKGIFPRELFKKAGDLGMFGIRIDPKWGGSGQDWWATAAYVEAMRHSDSGSINMAFLVQSDMTIPVIQELGTEDQKAEFIPPAVRGDWIGALGISEPGGGSDVAAIKTRARTEGNDLIISGQKLWITNGTRADYIVLAVRTGVEGHKGISLVLFPTKTKGFSVGKKLKKIGNLASDTAELFFDECRIPSRYILGQKDKGFYYIMENFQGERLVASLGSVASMEKALRWAIDYGHERTAFGTPVGKFQVWRHRWAEHLTALEAGRWLTYHALDMVNRGQKAVREITMAKLYTSELAQKIAYDAMQIFGGFSYTTEYPIGRMWRDVRLSTIGAGSSEIMKEIIAKEEKL